MYLLLSFSVLLLNVILVYFSRLMFYPVVVKTCDFENQTIMNKKTYPFLIIFSQPRTISNLS